MLPETRRPVERARARGGSGSCSSWSGGRELESHSGRIRQQRLLPCRHGDVELDRAGVLAHEVLRLLEDLEVAVEVLLDPDRHRRRLAVPELELDRGLPLAFRDAPALDLATLRRQVERGADLERRLLVQRSVADV